MRLVLTGFLILISNMLLWSQNDCNITTSGGIEAHPDSAYVGETFNIVFNILNEAQGDDCCYEPDMVLATLTIPDGIMFQSIVSPAGGTGDYFNWWYDSNKNVVRGLNYNLMCDAEGETNVSISLLALTQLSYPKFIQINLTLSNYYLGPVWKGNDASDDNPIVVVKILEQRPAPIGLASFNAVAESCNQVNLFWKAESEVNNDYMEIQRSEDGREFVPVGKVKGKNLSGAATYNYSDSDLKSSTTYFYRLRQVDFDGKVEFHKIISVRTKSCNDVKAFSIHPNPVINILNLGYDGFDNDEIIQCVVTNAIGELVRVYKDVTVTSLASIDVSAYKPGVYNIQIESNSNTFIKKFVKIY